MNTLKLKFEPIPEWQQEVLIAELSELGFDVFEQTQDALYAFIGQEAWDEEAIKASIHEVPYTVETIAPQNWNAVWEASFEPVIVDDFCTIRAHFHDVAVHTLHEIVITPKMSFGTGHHDTTRLMLLFMKDIDMKGKQVVDFGTGTGVLAIMAEKLGAEAIYAIDNDAWSVENTEENLQRNGAKKVTVGLVTDNTLPVPDTHIMLANINRHVLLHHMTDMYSKTLPGGHLLVSGILADDEPMLLQSAQSAGYTYQETRQSNHWLAMHFMRL